MSAKIAVTRFVQTPETVRVDVRRIRRRSCAIRPGDVLDLFTEDCFGGQDPHAAAICRAKSIEYPFINPQTGPFFVEGAEPGDTLAIHLIDVQPARDWAVSTHRPAVRLADRHQVHGDPPAGAAGADWLYARRSRRPRGDLPGARFRRSRSGSRSSPSTARSASRRPPTRRATCSSPRPSAGTWTRPRRAPGRRSISA